MKNSFLNDFFSSSVVVAKPSNTTIDTGCPFLVHVQGGHYYKVGSQGAKNIYYTHTQSFQPEADFLEKQIKMNLKKREKKTIR